MMLNSSPSVVRVCEEVLLKPEGSEHPVVRAARGYMDTSQKQWCCQARGAGFAQPLSFRACI